MAIPGASPRAGRRRRAWSALAGALLVACVAPQEPAGEGERLPPGGPSVRVLGSVQDGGLPHAACSCERCSLARRAPEHRRRVASLGIVLPVARRLLMIDATPDFPAQLAELTGPDTGRPGAIDRDPLDGILLTHAHVGHYVGLSHLGFEAIHTRGLPVDCTPAMARFLRENEPWSRLIELENIVLVERPAGSSWSLGDGVSVRSFAVPHRDELSDTVGYRLTGPSASLLYVPDTDRWDTWRPTLPQVVEGVDVALLDGTFFDAEELPGRGVGSVGHPLMTETMDLLASRVAAGTLRVYFIHLNHSNTALTRGSAARRALEARGFGVVEEGQRFPL